MSLGVKGKAMRERESRVYGNSVKGVWQGSQGHVATVSRAYGKEVKGMWKGIKGKQTDREGVAG